MLTPGAIRSGLKSSGTPATGPRAEKAATMGAGWAPTWVPRKTSLAVPLGLVRVRDRLLPTLVVSVPDDRSGAAGLPHDLRLHDPVDATPVAYDDLPGRLCWVERTVHAEGGREFLPGGRHVLRDDDRERLVSRCSGTAVEGFSGENPAVAEYDVRREVAVHRTGSNGRDPWGDVVDGHRAGAVVPGGGRNEDAGSRGREGADRDRISVEGQGVAASDGDGDNIDAVPHGTVEGR
ncbi:hypothetical protein EJ110_NYTH22804 [Nymphaea thermarum]|nr:hypothetical protein EJ110_NYTH22804 [Nymphaea thermarum]